MPRWEVEIELTHKVEHEEDEGHDEPLLPVVVTGDEGDEEGRNDEEQEDLVSCKLVDHAYYYSKYY